MIPENDHCYKNNREIYDMENTKLTNNNT